MGSHTRSSIMGLREEGEHFLKNLGRSFTKRTCSITERALSVMKGKGGSSRPPKESCQKGQPPCTCVCREEPSILEDERRFWLSQVFRSGMLHSMRPGLHTQRGPEIKYAPEFIPQLPGKEKGCKPTGGLAFCQPCVSETDVKIRMIAERGRHSLQPRSAGL